VAFFKAVLVPEGLVRAARGDKYRRSALRTGLKSFRIEEADVSMYYIHTDSDLWETRAIN
jgi:hypothetical protein